MAVPSTLADLSATAASNSPAGSEAIGTNADNYLRAIQAIIKRVTTGADAMSAPNIDGGTIDGATIGGSSAAAGTFTTLTATSAVVFPDSTRMGTASSLGFRNRLINGSFGIDQRNSGAAQTVTAAAALAYTVDRWYGYCTGANVTGQRVSGTAPNQYNYRYTGAASVTKIGHAQRIEAANSQDLAGTTATLSVDLANSLLAAVTWTVWYANSTDTFGTLASPTRTQISTGTFTVTSTLTRYNTQISIPAAATTGIEIEFSVGAQTSGTWTIGRAQFEVGSVATPFESRSIGQELALCQRYYWASGIKQTLWMNTTDFYDRGGVRFPVEMRTTSSSIDIYAQTSGTGGAVRNINTSADISVTGSGQDKFGIYYLTTTASGVANNAAGYSVRVSAEL